MDWTSISQNIVDGVKRQNVSYYPKIVFEPLLPSLTMVNGKQKSNLDYKWCATIYCADMHTV